MTKISRMRGQQMCSLANSKLGRQHTRTPLAAAIGSFMNLNYDPPSP